MKVNRLFGLLSFLAIPMVFSISDATGASLEGETTSSSSPSLGISAELLDLAVLSELPRELKDRLAVSGLEKSRLMVFFDFDDTVAQREFNLKGGYDFKYLSSAEVHRQLGPVINSIAQEKELDIASIKKACEYIRLSTDADTFAFSYPEKIPFKEGVLVPLQEMNAVVKICSGMALNAGKKQEFVESLGLTADDYIYASDKADAVTQFILADYEAQKESGAEALSQNYVAVLVDNLYFKELTDSKFIDSFVEQMNRYSPLLSEQGINAVPFAVYSSRFMADVEQHREQIAQEIDVALGLASRLPEEEKTSEG